jgi:tripeptide aminopeptidase
MMRWRPIASEPIVISKPKTRSSGTRRRPVSGVNGRAARPDGAIAPPFDANRAIELVMKLMAIPGPSGQEAEVAQFIRRQLCEAGVPARAVVTDCAHLRTPLAGNVGNLILRLPGTRRGPSRMLSAHLDTVPICVGSKPVRKGDLVRSADPRTGLGGDDRSGAAVLLTTAVEIVEQRVPHAPLTFVWFVQEEIGLQGARCVNKKMLGAPEFAFNFDGGPPEKVTIGATGGYRMHISVEGRASHAGGAPEEGISAVAIAGLAIAGLARNGWHGLIQKRGRGGGLLTGTSNMGVIHGGHATNVVADSVEIKAEARSHDPAFRRRIVREIERAFQRAARDVKNTAGESGNVRIDGRLDYESFRLPVKDRSVLAAQDAIRAVGREPVLAISNGGLDANWLVAHGIPTVTLGCGQRNIHTTEEQLDLAGFRCACQIALRLATG